MANDGPFGSIRGILITAALSLGIASAHAQQPDQLTEVFRDWTVQCRAMDDGGRRCAMLQTLQREGQRLLQMEMTIEKGKPQLVLLAPFGLLLPAGAQLTVDGGEPNDVAFRTCLPAGCIAMVEPDNEAISAFRRGDRLTFGFTAADNEAKGSMELSLAGFSAAMDRLSILVSSDDR